MALAQCFYYRLAFVNRQLYEMQISHQLNNVISLTHVGLTHSFKTILYREQERYLAILRIPDGIALTRAFKENIFVMLVGIVTRTPTILVDSHVSYGTLAMNILDENLNPVSKNENLTKLGIDNYVVHQFQCSKLTTPESIQTQWDHAVQVQGYDDTANRVLFLDEMGLAERSNKNPLNMLNRLLQEPTIAFIGFSNVRLDTFKMNRVVYHESMQDPDDLQKTALELARRGPGGKSISALNNKLPKLV
eukprot:291704_1